MKRAGISLALVLVLATASVAFACTPSAYIGLTPNVGPVGTEVQVQGRSFEPGPAEIRWNTMDGPVLGTATGPNFDTTITIPEAPGGVYYVVGVSKSADGAVRGKAAASFEITTPGGTSTQTGGTTYTQVAPGEPQSVTVAPSFGPSGSRVTVNGALFPSRPVELRWAGTTGPLMGTTIGPDFSATVEIPLAANGVYGIVAIAHRDDGSVAAQSSAPFQVTNAGAEPSPSPGPEPAAAQSTYTPPTDTVAPVVKRRPCRLARYPRRCRARRR